MNLSARLSRAVSGFRRGLMAVAERERAPDSDFWYTDIDGTGSAAGIPVTPQIAMQVSAVFACRKVIAETLAMLPLLVYERTGENSRRRAVDEPTYTLLHKRPNNWQTPYDFKEVLTGWAVLHGNGYARKVIRADGTTTALIPIHPSRVRIELVATNGSVLNPRLRTDALSALDADFQIRYMVKQSDGTERPLLSGEMLHIRGLSEDAVGGVMISKHARDAIALAQAMESFGARYFANDLTVGTTIEHPGQMSDKAYGRLQKAMEQRSGLWSAFKRMILEEGAKVSRQDAKATDAQLLEARLHQVVEICRYFRMPPHKIQHLANATFTNIEHQGIEFGTDTMQPWAVRWEQAVTRDLILDDEKYFAEVLMNGLMRGDSKARAEYYRERFYIGTMTRNQIRALENENPIDGGGGDEYYINAATVMIGPDGKPTPAAQEQPRLLPAPTAEPDDESEEEGEEDEGRAAINATASFAVLIHDAAERIVLAETRELDKRAGKRLDNPERFAQWASDFYDAHGKYIAKTLAPIAAAWVALGGGDPAISFASIADLCEARAVTGKPPVTAEEMEHMISSAFTWKVQRAA